MADNNPFSSTGQQESPEYQGVQRLPWNIGTLHMPENFQTRLPRSVISIAHELLPNLPHHVFQQSSASQGRLLPSAVSPNSQGDVTVDMASMMLEENNQGETININPQVAARMENIRSLLQHMAEQHQIASSAPGGSGGVDPMAAANPHSHRHVHAHSHGHSHGEGGQPEGIAGVQQSLTRLLQSSGIFFILLLLRFIYDHRLGLIVILAIGGTFYYVNKKLVQCIHETAVREVGSGRMTTLGYPLWLILFLVTNIFLLFYCFQDQALWKTFLYQMPVVADIDVWTLLWVVLLTDFVVKFATVAVKCLLFLLPPCCIPYRYRGQYYMFTEKLSQLYRITLPVIPWIHYLQDDQDIGRLFALITVVIYLLFKMNTLWVASLEVLKAFRKFRLRTSFGTKPGSEDLKQRGTTCPICQDEFKDPVLLACKHIFCENCVSLWFDREKTCPMCRAQITDDPEWRDGSTNPSLQWY